MVFVDDKHPCVAWGVVEGEGSGVDGLDHDFAGSDLLKRIGGDGDVTLLA